MSVTDATRAQIDAGLEALVVHGGNSSKASEACGTSASTLRLWKKTHGEAYRRMELAYYDELEDATRARAQATAHRAGELEDKLLDRIEGQIDRMDGKDAATAARAVADVKSKNIDKWLVLSNRSPEGAGNRDEDLWKEFEAGVRKGTLRLMPGVEPEDTPGTGEG